MKRFVLRASATALVSWSLRVFTPPAIHICPFHWLTGRPCPLCGLTRAMFELAKGHWRAGLALHALTPLAVVMLLAAVFEVPGRGRLWPVAMAAFAAYGAGRILFPAWAGVA